MAVRLLKFFQMGGALGEIRKGPQPVPYPCIRLVGRIALELNEGGGDTVAPTLIKVYHSSIGSEG